MNIHDFNVSHSTKVYLLSLRRKAIEHIINNYISMLGYVDTDSVREYWNGRALMHINTELSEYEYFLRGGF